MKLTWRRENFDITRPVLSRTGEQTPRPEVHTGWVAYDPDTELAMWGIRYMLREANMPRRGKYWTVTHLTTGMLVPAGKDVRGDGLTYHRTREAAMRFVELLHEEFPPYLLDLKASEWTSRDKHAARGARNRAMARVREYFDEKGEDYYRWAAAARTAALKRYEL